VGLLAAARVMSTHAHHDLLTVVPALQLYPVNCFKQSLPLVDVSNKPGPDPSISDEEVLRAIRDLYGPAVGTSEVANRLDVVTQTADKYLRRLHEEGLINTRKIGRVRVWWLSDDGEKQLTNHS
jgi:predicted transcriptional regulator